ncbi:hypothetical protein GCM10009129_23370 [Psychrobacter aestuarii]|uniref:Uncharacterized protein n=1 Tax=Psychrobacter aestuarii TaxID=556327 RepID=A0ABP3FU20_9GAMM
MRQVYKSLSETVPYISSSPEVLTLCPCPPETSDTEVDGGIFSADCRARCECGELWVLGEYVCKHCGHESDMPF